MTKFKELRRKNGITQATLAKEIGIAQATISDIETEKTSPTAETIKKIAEYFGVTADYLLGIERPQTQSLHLKSEELSASEQKMLSAYRAAPQAIKNVVDVALEPYAPVQVQDRAM